MTSLLNSYEAVKLQTLLRCAGIELRYCTFPWFVKEESALKMISSDRNFKLCSQLST